MSKISKIDIVKLVKLVKWKKSKVGKMEKFPKLVRSKTKQNFQDSFFCTCILTRSVLHVTPCDVPESTRLHMRYVASRSDNTYPQIRTESEYITIALRALRRVAYKVLYM